MRWPVLVLAMAQAAMAAPACTRKPAGGVLFEVAQRAVKRARLVTATTWLYENGAWRTEVIDVDGKVARTETGRLTPEQLDDLRAELARAPWKTTRSDARCRADQPRSTRYLWKGRLLYTERTCNAVVLDDESRHVLDLVLADLHVPRGLDEGGPRTECLENPLAPGCS